MNLSVRLLLICSLVTSYFFTSGAVAQPATPAPVVATPAEPAPDVAIKKSVDEQLSEMRAAVANRLRIGVSVNTTSKMAGIHFRTSSTVVGTGEASTANTPALDFVWVNRLYEGPDTTKFDWFLGATFERERSLSSLTFKATNATTPQNVTIPAGQTPTFHGNLFTLGLRWTPNPMLFFPFALNYGFLTQGSWGSVGTFEMNPAVGYTVGVGYRLNPNLEFEAAYKIAKYNMILLPAAAGPAGNYLDGAVELSGVVVGGRFIF